jgi:thiol-activated cytolysin
VDIVPSSVWRGVAAVVIACAVASCGDSAGPVPADVNDYVAALPSWEAFAPPLADADTVNEGGVDESTEVIETTTYKCTTAPFSLTQTPDKIVTLDPDVNILWLGALLQGSGYKDGIGSLAEWSVRERAPLRVSIDLLTGANSRTVENPDLGSVTQAVGELVQAAEASGHHGGSSVSFSMQKTHSVRQGTLALGISTRYLGPTVTASLSASHNADEQTITAYFVQRMFTVSFVLPNAPSDLFSPAFTPARLQEEVDRGHVGSSNPPVYVASIVYGRILIFTFTSTATADSIRIALSAAVKKDSAGIDASLSRILTTADIRVVTVGGEGRNATALIRSGELADYFNEDAALTSARPISYTVRNLGDNSIARVSETTQYNLKECTAIPTTGQLQIDVTPNDATVSVYGPGGYTFGPQTGDQLLTELTPGGYSVTVSRSGFTTANIETTVNVGPEPTTVLAPLVDPNQTITGAIYTIQPTRLILVNGGCAETYPDIYHETRVANRLLTQRSRNNYLELHYLGTWDHAGTAPAPETWVAQVDTVFFSNKGNTTTDTAMTFFATMSDNDGAGADEVMANRTWSYYKNQVPTGTGLYWSIGANGCNVRFEANITKTGDMFN